MAGEISGVRDGMRLCYRTGAAGASRAPYQSRRAPEGPTVQLSPRWLIRVTAACNDYMGA